MGFISNVREKMEKNKRARRARKALGKQQTTQRREYLLNENSPFDVTEAFRNLKAALSVSVPKQEGGTAITLTSAYPKDGKTMVSVNLALMFAMSNAKVILVDADIRKGRVAKYFKCKSSPGLSEYLSGQNAFDQIVHTAHTNPNLSFVTCGTHSPKPYELLESNEMKAFIEELRKKYDYVIIDTPPVLLISDALALTSVTDGTVLVCRHQSSYISDVANALNALKFAKTNVLGVVVNDYRASAASGSSYGNSKKYDYYNSYGYTYGTTTNENAEE